VLTLRFTQKTDPREGRLQVNLFFLSIGVVVAVTVTVTVAVMSTVTVAGTVAGTHGGARVRSGVGQVFAALMMHPPR
jgi:hypothetical protein